MKRRRDTKRYLRYIFRKVISRYEEIKATHGTASSPGFYENFSNGTGGSLAFNPRVIRVNAEDFIADVELTAKEALKNLPAERSLFRALYINGQTPSESEEQSPAFQALKHSAQERVGQLFRSRGIYPLGAYFKPSYH